MKISQYALDEIIGSWGEFDFQEDKDRESLSRLLNLGSTDLEELFILTNKAKDYGDYDTANATFAVLLEVLFCRKSDIAVEYEYDNSPDDYKSLVWLVLGPHKMNIPVPILKKGAFGRVLDFEKRRFPRMEHRRICLPYDGWAEIRHKELLKEIFGEHLILQACQNNLVDNHQSSWL